MPDSSYSEQSRDVTVRTDDVDLAGLLRVPASAGGIVLFAHGSGSSRLSRRNNRVADFLAAHGLASLLFDLLTEEEETADRRTRHLRFDIDLLADRLVRATRWLAAQKPGGALPIGYFGASTGAAAALKAAARPESTVEAIVSRGGRPDLAGQVLSRARCPTLLIVGGADEQVLELNRAAYAELRCEKRLAIVPGAGHLFEEPGALDRVAELTRDWFHAHLRGPRQENG